MLLKESIQRLLVFESKTSWVRRENGKDRSGWVMVPLSLFFSPQLYLLKLIDEMVQREDRVGGKQIVN